jgi:small-conductance mechanosensitive channel
MVSKGIDYLFNAGSSSFAVKLIAAISLLLIGFIVGRLLSKLIHKVLSELETHKILREQAGVKIHVEEFLSAIAKYIIYFIALIMALSQLGLTTTVLYILLFIILAILVAFIIMAFKDFVPNVVAGFFLHQKKIIKEGDYIQLNETEGKVLHVNLIETKIKTKKGDIVYIPNSILTKSELTKKNPT